MELGDPQIEMHAFVVASCRGEPANLATEEHDDVRWFRPSELAGLVLPDPTSRPDIVNAMQNSLG